MAMKKKRKKFLMVIALITIFIINRTSALREVIAVVAGKIYLSITYAYTYVL